MLPIHVMYDSKVDRDEEMGILEGISQALMTLRFQGDVKILGSEPWFDGDYPSVDWYELKTTTVHQAKVGYSQLDAGRLLGLLMDTKWPETGPHIDLMFVSQDLTARDENGWLDFVFGVAGKRASVQSIARLRKISDKHAKTIAVKALAQHGLGYVLGAKNADAGLIPHMAAYYNPGSCRNSGCAMQNGLS